MALLDKLKQELDRAGKVAQDALDEGKTRLEAFRTRQLADKAAQALGYAVFRARQGGSDLDADTYSRLSATLSTHDAEASRLEAELDRSRRADTSTGSSEPGAAPGSTTGASTQSPYSDTTAGGSQSVDSTSAGSGSTGSGYPGSPS